MYTSVAMLIMLPLLGPGYIFALDMVFGPDIRLPDDINASYPFYGLLYVISYGLPVWVIQKILLVLIIILSGIGAHRLTGQLLRDNKSDIKQWGCYFAGILYVVNPFTYVRFMDGHFSVLLGYALLPFFVRVLFELLFDKKFSWKTSLRLALYAVAISVVSIHAIGYLVVITFAALLVFVWKNKQNRRVLKQATIWGGFAVALFLALSSYWIIPTLLKDTQRERLVNSFDERYFLSFRTNGANDMGVVGNVLTMNGYWGDREDRYTLPRDVIPLWPLFFFGIFLLAVAGLSRSHKDSRVQTLLIGAIVSAVLAIGIAAVPFSYINDVFIRYLPFFRGFREPQKFVSLIVLFYAVTGGVGLANLLQNKVAKNYRPWLIVLALILPFLYTPTFLWGFAGQLKSRDYTADWALVDQQYVRNAQGKVLFLPWHQYMYFDFAGRVIANPAPVYFGKKVIAGDNAEIGLIGRQQQNNQSEMIEEILTNNQRPDLVNRLADLDIEYIILAKTTDWQEYSFLNSSGINKIKETDSLVVYQLP